MAKSSNIDDKSKKNKKTRKTSMIRVKNLDLSMPKKGSGGLVRTGESEQTPSLKGKEQSPRELLKDTNDRSLKSKVNNQLPKNWDAVISSADVDSYIESVKDRIGLVLDSNVLDNLDDKKNQDMRAAVRRMAAYHLATKIIFSKIVEDSEEVFSGPMSGNKRKNVRGKLKVKIQRGD
ncbi:hypothetical protein HFV06_08505 [Pseudomonas fluorescens]|nr:hypothetical protein [Pseudomonas fluorescens]NKI51379.1 hypothetical protein [Pseudomonas fluorescens]NKI63872.1 hypothetical protein [Pseudomonas fluorescens]